MNGRYPIASTPEQHAAEPFMVESRVPVGPTRFETHVQVPVALAGIVSLAVTFGLAIGSWRFDWPWDATWIGGLVVFIVVLAWRLLWVDHISWRLERMTGMELDGKPGIGNPEHPFVIQNKAEAQSKARAAATQVWRESRAAELIQFAAACATQGTSEEDQKIKSKSQREKYLERRGALFELGLAVWKNPAVPNSAWVLTATPEKTAEIIEDYVK